MANGRRQSETLVIGSSARDAEIFLNKQVKFKDLKNYASPNKAQKKIYVCFL